MPAKIVLGAQWGDEGKAKVVDYMTLSADIVARYQGGANAGHTVQVGDSTFVFHIIPSGIIHSDKICVIGNGVVADPVALIAELDELESRGIRVADRLFISGNAHVVMPYHKALEKAAEEDPSGLTIGTTLRGIGPCYRDKIDRSNGVRMTDLMRPHKLRGKLRSAIQSKNEILARIYATDVIEENGTIDEFVAYGKRLQPYITDTSALLNNALDAGKTVLFEGAQGTLLDVDHGTYPFVTSSNTTAGGACTGSGVGPTRIAEVIGVTKAYTTRVGNGPFPTELDDENGERIRAIGHEYGATTGRSRRCGWFDAPIVRLAGRINGLTSIALTRLDVLDTLERLKLCVAYDCDGTELSEFPSDPEQLENCKPIYEELPGWQTETTSARRFNDLHPNARRYVDRISELTGRPVSLISVGPERESTIDVS